MYERAVRNCPWSHTIWADYIRSLERFNKEHSVVVKVFEECLSVGFNEPGAYLEVGVWNVFSDLFSLNFIVLFLNTLKLVSKLVSKKVYTALKVWHTIMVLVFFLLLGLVGLCWLYATAVRFWGGRDAIHAGTESNLWQGDGAFEQVIERDGYGLVGLISVSHWIILFPVVFLHAFHVNILNVKLTKEQVFQWEHGGVTSRPLRKLWQTDQPTDWRQSDRSTYNKLSLSDLSSYPTLRSTCFSQLHGKTYSSLGRVARVNRRREMHNKDSCFFLNVLRI